MGIGKTNDEHRKCDVFGIRTHHTVSADLLATP